MKHIIKHIAIIIAAMLSLLPVGCREQVSPTVEENPLIAEILRDTNSAYYFDASAYPADLHSLPIGVLGKDSLSFAILDSIMNVDHFDNITGDAQKDSIIDFAGEHFIFYCDPDTTSYYDLLTLGRKDAVTERIVRSAAKLLQNNVKIILIASDSATVYGLDDIKALIEAGGISVEVKGIQYSADELAAEGYLTLRGDRNLALRTTRQTLESNIEFTQDVPNEDITGRD